MKIKKSRICIVVSALLISSLGGFFYVNNLPEPDSRGLLFMTIGINQKLLLNESSSYEIQRASEHFSDLVLGWTIEPSFSRELDAKLQYHLNFSGSRQEKQNLIFYLTANPEQYNESANLEFLNLIKSRISEYDASTNSGYLIAVSRYSDLDSERSDLRIFLGIVSIVTLLTVLCLIIIDYASKNWSRSSSST